MDATQTRAGNTPHQLLARLSGAWAGEMRTWLEPAGQPVEARIRGSVQPILDGRFFLLLYQSTLQGEPLHGMFMFGYNTAQDRFEATWIDSFHNNTAMMFCSGEGTEQGFWVTGSYPDPSGGPDWGLRTEVVLDEPDRLAITAYNISPEGGQSMAIMSDLRRLAGRSE